jgi:hypothetical protein
MPTSSGLGGGFRLGDVLRVLGENLLTTAGTPAEEAAGQSPSSSRTRTPVRKNVADKRRSQAKSGSAWQDNYGRVGKFVDGRAAVCQNGKWGFVSESGALVVPCLYDRVTDFRGGQALVQMGKKVTRIDRTGRTVTARRRKRVSRKVKGNPYAHVDWDRVGGWAVRP